MIDTSVFGRNIHVRRVLDFIDPSIYPWLFGDLTTASSSVVVDVKPASSVQFESPRFLHANDFLENFVSYRLCYIGGRLGGGKTSLAIALARYLYDRGLVDGIFTNVPVDPRYIPVLNTVSRACVVLDEASLWASARGSGLKDIGYGAFARKLESWWVCSSKNKVDKELRDITVRRKADLWMFGWWLYAWMDEEGENSGWFIWTNPSCVFKRYRTGFIPADDGGILDILKRDISLASGSTRRVFLPNDKSDVVYRVSGYDADL